MVHAHVDMRGLDLDSFVTEVDHLVFKRLVSQGVRIFDLDLVRLVKV